jgi:hypothetical protein
MDESYSINIKINRVVFLHELSESEKENYRKKLKDSIERALTTRIVGEVGEMKILFNKK